jgi:hypothetical protein
MYTIEKTLMILLFNSYTYTNAGSIKNTNLLQTAVHKKNNQDEKYSSFSFCREIVYR